jgi:outer membrane lipoprotein-sorting protein
LERDLEAVFAIPVPSLQFEPGARAVVATPNHRRRWQFAAAGVIAAGLVAAIAFLPGYLGGATTANAEELLNRSAQATSDLKSGSTPYHLKAAFEGQGTEPFVSEVWSFGPAGNRSESRASDGTILNGQVATPNDYWMYTAADGQLRIAHVSGATDRVKDFEAQASSLDGLVQGLLIEGCQEAVFEGSAKVAGRDTQVVEVRPTPATCKAIPGRPETDKIAASIAQFGSYTVWIDKETNIQLKVESRDPDGAVTNTFTAQAFETGSSVDASVLTYSPPAGAQVFEAADYTAAKSAIYPEHQHAPETAK